MSYIGANMVLIYLKSHLMIPLGWNKLTTLWGISKLFFLKILVKNNYQSFIFFSLSFFSWKFDFLYSTLSPSSHACPRRRQTFLCRHHIRFYSGPFPHVCDCPSIQEWPFFHLSCICDVLVSLRKKIILNRNEVQAETDVVYLNSLLRPRLHWSKIHWIHHKAGTFSDTSKTGTFQCRIYVAVRVLRAQQWIR
jgi:hypothetical protein